MEINYNPGPSSANSRIDYNNDLKNNLISFINNFDKLNKYFSTSTNKVAVEIFKVISDIYKEDKGKPLQAIFSKKEKEEAFIHPEHYDEDGTYSMPRAPKKLTSVNCKENNMYIVRYRAPTVHSPYRIEVNNDKAEGFRFSFKDEEVEITSTKGKLNQGKKFGISDKKNLPIDLVANNLFKNSPNVVLTISFDQFSKNLPTSFNSDLSELLRKIEPKNNKIENQVSDQVEELPFYTKRENYVKAANEEFRNRRSSSQSSSPQKPSPHVRIDPEAIANYSPSKPLVPRNQQPSTSQSI